MYVGCSIVMLVLLFVLLLLFIYSNVLVRSFGVGHYYSFSIHSLIGGCFPIQDCNTQKLNFNSPECGGHWAIMHCKMGGPR